jgi:hypothetical protein
MVLVGLSTSRTLYEEASIRIEHYDLNNTVKLVPAVSPCENGGGCYRLSIANHFAGSRADWAPKKVEGKWLAGICSSNLKLLSGREAGRSCCLREAGFGYQSVGSNWAHSL